MIIFGINVTLALIVKTAAELSLAICIKLFCENGRIHYQDIGPTFLFTGADENGMIEDGLTKELKERGIEW